MNLKTPISFTFILLLSVFFLNSCETIKKLPGSDARKFPADPAKRVEQNLKEGRGFKINDAYKGIEPILNSSIMVENINKKLRIKSFNLSFLEVIEVSFLSIWL